MAFPDYKQTTNYNFTFNGLDISISYFVNGESEYHLYIEGDYFCPLNTDELEAYLFDNPCNIQADIRSLFEEHAEDFFEHLATHWGFASGKWYMNIESFMEFVNPDDKLNIMDQIDGIYLDDEFEYIDNERLATKGNPQQESIYKERQKHGCCGFFDTELKGSSGQVYLFGFNYGH